MIPYHSWKKFIKYKTPLWRLAKTSREHSGADHYRSSLTIKRRFRTCKCSGFTLRRVTLKNRTARSTSLQKKQKKSFWNKILVRMMGRKKFAEEKEGLHHLSNMGRVMEALLMWFILLRALNKSRKSRLRSYLMVSCQSLYFSALKNPKFTVRILTDLTVCRSLKA